MQLLYKALYSFTVKVPLADADRQVDAALTGGGKKTV